jgi:hypothetical protein
MTRTGGVEIAAAYRCKVHFYVANSGSARRAVKGSRRLSTLFLRRPRVAAIRRTCASARIVCPAPGRRSSVPRMMLREAPGACEAPYGGVPCDRTRPRALREHAPVCETGCASRSITCPRAATFMRRRRISGAYRIYFLYEILSRLPFAFRESRRLDPESRYDHRVRIWIPGSLANARAPE